MIPDAAPRRYASDPFPPYRYVPGRTPHPRRHPAGHSYGRPEPRPALVAPEAWATSGAYLAAVDLFNFGYWWECHEAFEALWNGAGRQGEQARFLQGLIQIAAAGLKRVQGPPAGARALARRGMDRLAATPSPYMGIDVRALLVQAETYFFREAETPPRVILLEPA
jgi:uncharacterized protein